jgi:oxygen-independent coproporphyrinogen-3 oxidase
MTEISPELLLRHARPGPRYTSYPTAPSWTARQAISDALWFEGLRRLRGPASVYVHVPFCEAQCSYCACNMVVAGRRSVGTRYLDALARQVEGLTLPQDQVEVAWIHLGGGTPTWLEPEALERLFAILRSRFAPLADAQVSVEADPAITSLEHLDTLVACGARRISLGVQSFDPVVLAAVNRPQAFEDIQALVGAARDRGFERVNLDLIYGLPHQTPERFAGTLERTLSLRPDRLALFGYAHVPWLKPHQAKLDADALPGPIDRAALFLQARRALLEAGYEPVGMDHFALPDDPLAVARRERRLGRNFMGYTTLVDSEMVGLGMSAISDFGDRYIQHQAKLSRWWKAAGGEGPLIEKAALLTPEDQLRRAVITGLMCNFALEFAPIERRFGVDFAGHFADELAGLTDLEADGLVERQGDRLVVPEAAQLFVRNVAMRFDQYLNPRRAEAGGGPRYSQTI